MLTRKHQYHCRVTEQEQAAITELAELLGVDRTKAVLEAVDEYLRRLKAKKPRKVAAW